jgi:hypothetical protein
MEMKVLGDRSPYEVVTGLKPVMPATLRARLPVGDVNVDEYVKDLVEHLAGAREAVARVQQGRAEQELSKAKGRQTAQLSQGDLVVVRVPPRHAQQEGRAKQRLEPKAEPVLFTITRVRGPGTSQVTPIDGGPQRQHSYDASQLVRITVPNLDRGSERRRRLEIHDDQTDQWRPGEVERVSIDGRAEVRFDATPGETEWLDLARRRYRWCGA